MSLTSADIILIVVSTILSLITILLVIWEAEEQMFVFGLRPSESISTDIAGLITLSKGLAGDAELSYKNMTTEIIYNITASNKLVCVTSFSRYVSTDCSSSVLEITDNEKVGGKEFTVSIEKVGEDVTFELES